MPWTVADPPRCAQNWTEAEKRRCVEAANAVLREGGTEEEAIYACIHAAGRSEKMTDEAEAVKAEWTTAYINDLPDAAFAYIEPGGEKDEEGKTVPRSLRHFPHHTMDVKDPDEHDTVDLPHLRNALARAPQSPFGEKALPHLRRHAKALGVGEAAEEEKGKKAEDAPEAIQEREEEPEPVILTAVKAHPSGIVGWVCGYGAPFGGPFQGKDLDGEYFAPDTDFALDWYSERPVLYHHGLDAGTKTAVVGRQTKAEVTDLGVWIEAQLDRSNRYFDAIWKLVQEGKLFWSSGSLPHLVKRNADGKLERWPVVEFSLTPTPANPMALAEPAQVKSHFKSVGLEFVDPTAEQEQNEQEEDEMTVDVEQLTAEVLNRLEEKRKAEEEARRKEEERIKAIKAEAVEEFKKELASKSQFPLEFPGKDGPTVKEVWSPYDRLSTGELCTAYMLMKAQGRKPSERMYKALMQRAVQAAQEQDTLYIRDGQPVKAPAIDWAVIAPVKALKGEEPDSVGEAGWQKLREIAVKANELVYSTQSSYGDEWVPTLWSAELWRQVRLNAAVLGLFEQFDMPSQPYDYPVESTDPTVYKVAEATNEAQLVLTGGPFSDSKIGTAKVTFSAGKIGALTYWTEEMDEDSIIRVEPQFRDQFGLAMAHAIDAVLLHGDETTGTANISYYGSTIASTNKYLIVDGLRHQPLVTTTTDKFDAGTLTADDVNHARSLMGDAGKYGINPADLVIICDGATYFKFVGLDEVLTVDKFGDAATILRGQLASIFGIPVIVSEDYGLTDSSGYINATAASNSKGQFLVVNRRLVKVGWRRRPRITVERLPLADAHAIVATARLDIQFFAAGGVACGYDVTV